MNQTGVHLFLDEGLVEVLTDEDNLLHTIAIDLVPIAAKVGIALQHHFEFALGHGSEPTAGIANGGLTTSLLEDVADVLFVGKIANALGTDDVLWPTTCHEVVEETEDDGLAGIIDVGSDAIFFGFSFPIVMMMVWCAE